MSRRAPLALLALVSLGLSLGARPGAAQQADPPFRAVPGRYLPAPLPDPALRVVLDTYTGRISVAPAGEAIAGEAWVLDVDEALLWRRPLARDVSAGRVLQHGLPLAGEGAGAPVFAWQPDASAPGVLDTRTGVHYLVLGDLLVEGAAALRIVRTDLRLLTRSVREVTGSAGH